MIDQENKDYHRVASAIEYINVNVKEQPSLKEMAKAVGISHFHFQRLFTEWAGVNPRAIALQIDEDVA